MKRSEFERLRREAAEELTHFERLLTISVAKELRLMDQEQRLSSMAGAESTVDPTRKRRLEAIYKILSLGNLRDRFTILFGKDDEVDNLVAMVLHDDGFYCEESRAFIEL